MKFATKYLSVETAEDTMEWLDKVAPPSWTAPANGVAEALLPEGGDYRNHRGGEDNGDAHLKNLLVHHQAIVPVTAGQRVVIKAMGE